MSTIYVGNATAVQPPASAPAQEGALEIVLTADGDDLNAASVAQAFKATADSVTWLQQIGTRVWQHPSTGNVAPLQKLQDQNGNLRSLVDHNGFSGMGDVMQYRQCWFTGSSHASSQTPIPEITDFQFENNSNGETFDTQQIGTIPGFYGPFAQLATQSPAVSGDTVYLSTAQPICVVNNGMIVTAEFDMYLDVTTGTNYHFGFTDSPVVTGSHNLACAHNLSTTVPKWDAECSNGAGLNTHTGTVALTAAWNHMKFEFSGTTLNATTWANVKLWVNSTLSFTFTNANMPTNGTALGFFIKAVAASTVQVIVGVGPLTITQALGVSPAV